MAGKEAIFARKAMRPRRIARTAPIGHLQKLPQDELREILIRVAAQPEGAKDIASTFTVSKTLHNFSEDKSVLCAVSFEGFLPHIIWLFAFFSEIGGLVAKCARAGNPVAQFILAKVALTCASRLCSAKLETAQLVAYPALYTLSLTTYNLSVVDKAASFLNHFSNRMELFLLVRNYLSRAEVRDLSDMQRNLKDFIALYLVRDKKPQYQQFLTTFETLFDKSDDDNSRLEFTSDALTFLVRFNNTLCCAVHNMKSIELDEVIHPLEDRSIQMNYDVVYETMIERLDTVNRTLELGGKVMADNPRGGYMTNNFISTLSELFRSGLNQLMDREAFVKGTRGLLLASFDAIFDINQGSP